VKEGGYNLLPIYLSALATLYAPGQSSHIKDQKVRKTYLWIVKTTKSSPVQNPLAAAKSSRTPENLPLFP